ncbi:MAG TPA: hypothetical protein P5168_02005, partial [Candidatus Methanomethylicus sp.]|nr:hypothetical protein [Candidatus Methanomethylicus sp.]
MRNEYSYYYESTKPSNIPGDWESAMAIMSSFESRLILIGALVFALFFICLPGTVSAATITVNTTGYTDVGGFHASPTPIQSAVSAAAVGDTIRVLPGDYYDNVIIDKELELLSDSLYGAQVFGANSSLDAFKITANGVTITGFRIENAHAGISVYGNSSTIA